MFVQTSIRSSVGTAKEALSHKIQYLTEFLGGEYETEGAYPAWEYRKASPLRDKMVEIYKNMYGKDLEVVAIHAGLECGIFYERMENLDCTSLGPDILDIQMACSSDKKALFPGWWDEEPVHPYPLLLLSEL